MIILVEAAGRARLASALNHKQAERIAIDPQAQDAAENFVAMIDAMRECNRRN
jgi:hypothetical protein